MILEIGQKGRRNLLRESCLIQEMSPNNKKRGVAGGMTAGANVMNRARDPSLREKMIRTNIMNGCRGVHSEQHLQDRNGPCLTRFHPDRYFSPQIQRKKYVEQWDNLRTCISTETLREDDMGTSFTPALRQKSVTFSDEVIVHES